VKPPSEISTDLQDQLALLLRVVGHNKVMQFWIKRLRLRQLIEFVMNPHLVRSVIIVDQETEAHHFIDKLPQTDLDRHRGLSVDVAIAELVFTRGPDSQAKVSY
jgi:hypothetical protein